MSSNSLDSLCINGVRCLAAALPEAAKSGHPGAPMGCAPMAHALFGYVMNFNPEQPSWIARDRFVLSNGHACALHYTMLHLLGYNLSLDDLKKFRQVDSATPGHPEHTDTIGIEVTSGPLGQGIAQAVGLAIAGEMLAATYNKPDIRLFDNYVFVVVGDGCLQEGVSGEASSLAGHLGLGRLIVLYDRNQISIDGDTDLSFTENVEQRYTSYGWEVLHVDNGDHDFKGLVAALTYAKTTLNKPTLIICNTTIGFGSKNQGTEKVHGAPLGADDLKQVREKFNLESKDIFSFPDEARKFYSIRRNESIGKYSVWQADLQKYSQKYPAEFAEIMERFQRKKFVGNVTDILPKYTPKDKAEATRALSGTCLNALADKLPYIVGGSADLTTSNCSALKNTTDFTKINRLGRYIRFGVREHGMAAISNGIFASGAFRPFAATFLNFVTYGWGAVRLSALSHFGILYIATHDSIELGEDGPTHQPIEVAALCRATPNVIYFRPADGNEVAAGYAVWMEHESTPTILALCRSAVPHLENSSIENAKRGAYVLEDFNNTGKPKLIIGASGSEVSLCIAATKILCESHDIRVVSMPSWELFRQQSTEYQNLVIPRGIKSLYVEAANTMGCEHWFTASHGMNTFGSSGPKAKVFEKFGFTPENIARIATEL